MNYETAFVNISISDFWTLKNSNKKVKPYISNKNLTYRSNTMIIIKEH